MLFFCLFQCFGETEYLTESKRNETCGNVIFSRDEIQETWTLLQGTKEVVTRVGAPPPRACPLPRGPPVAPPTYSFLLYIPRYPQTIRTRAKNVIPQLQPSVSMIFYCSMLYYILFWTLLGFIIHFYIIFGANLLTGGPAQNCCFCLFQCFG